MNYWIFKVDPKAFLIDECLHDPDTTINWRVTRYRDRIQRGDIAFIWRTGTHRGIQATMKIDEYPYKLQEIDINPNPYWKGQPLQITDSNTWAKGRFIQRFPLIEASEIKNIPGLEQFSFFKAFQQATNFTVMPSEGAILLKYIEKVRPDGSEKTLPDNFPAAKARNPELTQTVFSDFDLLKCEDCGRYIVGCDTDNHIREAHAGQPVMWKKIK